MSKLPSVFRRILKEPYLRRFKKRNVIHFPDSILQPSRIVIYSGPGDTDIWPAMYLSDMLQNAYPETKTSIICNMDDGELLNMLQLKFPKMIYCCSIPIRQLIRIQEAF